MFSFAIIGFFISFAGLIALFSLKYVEFSKCRIYGSELRAKADSSALLLKALLHASMDRLEQLPHDFVVFLRMVVHVGAIIFAHGARAAERGAHKIADRVSHKHHFERTESRSEFLKSVSAHRTQLKNNRNL
ncbi:hypothetical protein HY413_02765 [Candidatus Kaiserbacteria bacterium]|nr:hypothetical protein [Candidatus Kaiserbacteria bacterium]